MLTTIPNDLEKKIEYDAAFLTGSAIVQAYHVMITKGLEYSYVSTGLALIMLRVPYDSPGTLYYRLFEPNSEITSQDDKGLTAPLTPVARVLGLCLMSCSSTLRDQNWRDTAKRDLPIWTASFNTTPFRATQTELNQVRLLCGILTPQPSRTPPQKPRQRASHPNFLLCRRQKTAGCRLRLVCGAT